METQSKIRTCIYQACQKKADHHGSLTPASGQFNLIRSEGNKRDVQRLATGQSLNTAEPGGTGRRQEWKEKKEETEKVHFSVGDRAGACFYIQVQG